MFVGMLDTCVSLIYLLLQSWLFLSLMLLINNIIAGRHRSLNTLGYNYTICQFLV